MLSDVKIKIAVKITNRFLRIGGMLFIWAYSKGEQIWEDGVITKPIEKVL